MHEGQRRCCFRATLGRGWRWIWFVAPPQSEELDRTAYSGVLSGEVVVLETAEAGGNGAVLGSLEDGPQHQVVSVSGGEPYPVQVGACVHVAGDRLGQAASTAVLEGGGVEVLLTELEGEADKLGVQCGE
jgi:hypothetical protein